jgi:hypothetical protein
MQLNATPCQRQIRSSHADSTHCQKDPLRFCDSYSERRYPAFEASAKPQSSQNAW